MLYYVILQWWLPVNWPACRCFNRCTPKRWCDESPGKIEKPKKSDFRQRAHCNPLCDWGDCYPARTPMIACRMIWMMYLHAAACAAATIPFDFQTSFKYCILFDGCWVRHLGHSSVRLRFLLIMSTGRSIFPSSFLGMKQNLTSCSSTHRNILSRCLAPIELAPKPRYELFQVFPDKSRERSNKVDLNTIKKTFKN